jgi:hypothetical protein
MSRKLLVTVFSKNRCGLCVEAKESLRQISNKVRSFFSLCANLANWYFVFPSSSAQLSFFSIYFY